MTRRKYSTKAKSNKWSMVGFYYLLDTARINSQTIWSLNNNLDPRTTSSYEFGMRVARSLIIPSILARPLIGLSSTIRSLCYAVTQNARFITPSGSNDSDSLASASSTTAARCHQCLTDIRGTPEYIDKRNKLNKIKSKCQKCSLNMCRNHIIIMCTACAHKA